MKRIKELNVLIINLLSQIKRLAEANEYKKIHTQLLKECDNIHALTTQLVEYKDELIELQDNQESIK
tara:strand:+ start:26164 stop:26364 length:201 start_codon:yes stop_codon:yes gene_type:complete